MLNYLQYSKPATFQAHKGYAATFVRAKCYTYPMQFERPQRAEKIGEGAYKQAFYENGNGDYVWVEFKHEYTPAQAKSIYYLNNIAHLLFPKHTVKIAQSGATGDKTTYLRSSYVSPAADPVHQAIQQETTHNDGQPFDESKAFDSRAAVMDHDKTINDFIDAYEAAGLKDNFAMIHAWGPQDLIFEADGNFRFVDVDPAWEEPEALDEPGYTDYCLRFNPEKLQAAIATLEGESKAKAEALFNRLITLCREQGFRL